MLNGIDPVIIFSFYKKTPSVSEAFSKIPLVAQYVNSIELPPIPIYLSEKLTGIFISSETKNLDIETTATTLADGEAPEFNQKGIGSVLTIEMQASKNSIGLSLLSAFSDLILSKVTSKEYSITYLHGATTMFNGLLHSLSITQTADDDLFRITLEISKGNVKKVAVTQPTPDSGAATLDGNSQIVGGSLPASSPAAGASFTTPPSPVTQAVP